MLEFLNKSFHMPFKKFDSAFHKRNYLSLQWKPARKLKMLCNVTQWFYDLANKQVFQSLESNDTTNSFFLIIGFKRCIVTEAWAVGAENTALIFGPSIAFDVIATILHLDNILHFIQKMHLKTKLFSVVCARVSIFNTEITFL